MKKYWYTWIVLLTGCTGYAQVLPALPAFGYNSAVACSREYADASACVANQASLAEVKNFSFAVCSERKFLLRELSAGSAAIVFPAAEIGRAHV